LEKGFGERKERVEMLTTQQKMQIRRAIASRCGFDRDSVTINEISNVKKNIVIEGGSIEIKVDFTHEFTRYNGQAYFRFRPSDMRKMPIFEGFGERG
jgi:hypothetical protein